MLPLISVIKLKAIMIVHKLGKLIKFLFGSHGETRYIPVNDTDVVISEQAEMTGFLNFVDKMPNQCISDSTVVHFFLSSPSLLLLCMLVT